LPLQQPKSELCAGINEGNILFRMAHFFLDEKGWWISGLRIHNADYSKKSIAQDQQ